MKRFINILFLMTTLSGCAGILSTPSEPPRLMTINPLIGEDLSKSIKAIDAQLTIEKPLCHNSLNTSRIALKESSNELKYFSGIEWEDRLPQMVQNLIARALDDQKLFKSVGNVKGVLYSDYQLQTEIRKFQAVYKPEDSAVEITLAIKLIKLPERQVIKQTIVSHKISFKKDVFENIAQAFEQAFSMLLLDLSKWIQN